MARRGSHTSTAAQRQAGASFASRVPMLLMLAAVGGITLYAALDAVGDVQAQLGMIAAIDARLVADRLRTGRPLRASEALGDITLDGRPVAKRLALLDPPVSLAQGGPAPWPQLTRSAPVVVDGATRGSLGASVNIDPSLARVGLVTALGLLTALAFSLLVRVVPRRAVDAMLREQRASDARFDTALNNLSQGVCFFDGQRRLIVSNARYAEIYDLAADQVRPGTTLEQIVEHRYAIGSGPDMTPEDYLAWRDRIAVSDQPTNTEVRLRNGRIVAIHHRPMPDRGWVATHEDVTERRAAEARIVHLAGHDQLTGLPNRATLWDHLAQAAGRARQGGAVAVLMLDLDRFKTVNDTLGHPVGDGLLCAVADRLRACTRHGDLVARLGGDEFAIVQAAARQPGEAVELAGRLTRLICQPFDVAGHAIEIGTSIGIALGPDHGSVPEELLRRADMALYQAKSEGRGRLSVFQPELEDQARARRAIERDLRLALDRGEFELFYQPILQLGAEADSLRTICFEALLRWRHPQRGLVPPADFIPLAEENGLILPLGEWVLDAACAEAAGWPDGIRVAVNISPRQFATGQLVGVVTAALARAGLAAARLELELTETVLLADTSAVREALDQLRELGVGISLDDFGVGYSSLSYLRAFPLDRIKIDRSFVRDIARRGDSLAIITAVATLGRSLGMAVTAEGVEDAQQLSLLRMAGCTEVQGYLFSPAVPAGQVARLLGQPAVSDAG